MGLQSARGKVQYRCWPQKTERRRPTPIPKPYNIEEHCPTKPGPKLATRGTEATIPTKIPTKSYKTLEHGKCFYCKADEKTRNSTLRWGLLQSIRIM